jgi:hypothetical protein
MTNFGIRMPTKQGEIAVVDNADVKRLVDERDAVDALLRWARGLDTKDGELIASAFTPEGTFDMRPGYQALGYEFTPMVGSELIGESLAAGLQATGLITTHCVTNTRVALDGDGGSMEAYVEAQHIVPTDHDRYLLMKNHYTIELGRTSHGWGMQYLTLANVWFQGDRTVLAPPGQWDE